MTLRETLLDLQNLGPLEIAEFGRDPLQTRAQQGERVEQGGVAVTRVTFRALEAQTVDWYLATGEWHDRAGGYAIQGRGAGLVAAAARGRMGGRKPVVTPDKLRRARALIAQGLNVREAAARLKLGKTALYEALAAEQGQPRMAVSA